MHAPLQPPDHLEGRFAPAEILPGGWYAQINDSSVLRADLTRRVSGEVVTPGDSRRSSIQSVGPASRSSSRSIPVPRRVESIVGADAIVAYHNQQAAQRPAGGAYYEAPRRAYVHQGARTHDERQDRDQPLATTPASTPGVSPRSSPRSSTSTTSLHFPPTLPARRPPTPPQSYIPTHPSEPTKQPTLPLPVYRPGTSAARTGRSPLARKSFTRLAVKSPTGEVEAEVEREVEVRVPRRGDQEERRGRRRRRSVSVDGRGRRRLSKRGRGSGEA